MRFTVSGKELKSTFKDISAQLRGYDRAKVVGVSVERGKVSFVVDTGSYYMRTLEISNAKDVVELSVTVLYADLTNFISARDDAEVELTEFYMMIVSKNSKLTLNIGESLISPYKMRHGVLTDLDFGTFRSMVKVFTGASELQKIFKRDFAISIYKDRAILKSPVVWIETKAQGLNCILSIEQMKSILMFQPEFVEVSDRLEFRKGSALLSLPCLTPVEFSSVNKLISGMRQVTAISLIGVLKDLQEVKRTLGVCQTMVHVHNGGFVLQMNKSGVSLSRSYNAGGDSQVVFDVMLDLFAMCLNILGDEEIVYVYWKEGLVCLKNTVTSIAISV